MSKETNKKGVNRRDFIKQAGMGGLGLGAVLMAPYEQQLEQATSRVNRNSAPSDLEITDMRIAEIDGIPFRTPIIRIDTNQGISGFGEVRDGGDPRYALMLKSRILGLNPCNVEKIFKIIRQFGDHGRQGGGVSGVETALWDLTGKAYGVPVYQLLGGKYRDKVRLYADTAGADDPHVFARRMKETRVDKGYTALKMDIGIGLLDDIEGALVNTHHHAPQGSRELQSQYSGTHGEYGQIDHPFTRIQITEKGLDALEEYVSVMRDTIGYEIPLGIDHTGHFDTDEAIKLAHRLEPYTLAYMEDMVAWKWIDKWKEITRSTTTPTMTGEDIFGLEGGFKELIDKQAVNMVHPDLGSTGGILETKRIGDYAQQGGLAMYLHYAGSPIGFFASVHAAAATENFVALEHHSVENDAWYSLIAGDTVVFDEGYVPVPEKPGLGFDLNMEAVKELLIDGAGFFEPTPEWDEQRSWDRLWS
ncbi:mandelate racemase/muconate lactonizing enzyme family protein [Halalkalibaculum sp. DA384]|uniref:mandelate racemase/muconate lactonizing enzyme family protein n=1 Tax=Halalkalibaculum sp. DA384 TaxID=3373606 RepID=UPI00375431E2